MESGETAARGPLQELQRLVDFSLYSPTEPALVSDMIRKRTSRLFSASPATGAPFWVVETGFPLSVCGSTGFLALHQSARPFQLPDEGWRTEVRHQRSARSTGSAHPGTYVLLRAKDEPEQLLSSITQSLELVGSAPLA